MLKNVDEKIIGEFEKLPLDFWDFKKADTKELTHGIHSYPAVMIYPISRKLIEIFTKHQDINTLYDPFAGSGTVLVEGFRYGFNDIYGTDLNPLSRLIIKVRTNPINFNDKKNKDILDKFRLEFNLKKELNLYKISKTINDELIDSGIDLFSKDEWGNNAEYILNNFLTKYNEKSKMPEFENIGYWFLPSVILQLQLIKDAIMSTNNDSIKNFLWVSFSETVRISSNRRNSEFKMFRMKKEKLENYNPDVFDIFEKYLNKNLTKMSDFYNTVKEKSSKVFVYNNDVRDLYNISDNSIDFVITSPPYGDSRTTVAYGEFSKVSLLWLGLDIDELGDKDSIKHIDKMLLGGKPEKTFINELPSETLKESLSVIADRDYKRACDVYEFYKGLDKSISEITKKMVKNSYQCWVVGNRTVKEEKLLTDKIISELAESHGLCTVCNIARNIPSKAMPSLNSPTNIPGEKLSTMTNEHILVLRKK